MPLVMGREPRGVHQHDKGVQHSTPTNSIKRSTRDGGRTQECKLVLNFLFKLCYTYIQCTFVALPCMYTYLDICHAHTCAQKWPYSLSLLMQMVVFSVALVTILPPRSSICRVSTGLLLLSLPITITVNPLIGASTLTPPPLALPPKLADDWEGPGPSMVSIDCD